MQPFDDDEIDAARARTSIKWRSYPDDVIPAWIAEMDFPLAPALTDALHRAIAHGDTGYCWPQPAIDAFTAYAGRRWSWDIDPSAVMALGDVVTGIAQALRQLTPEGCGVVINTPIYPPFFSTVSQITGRRLVDVPLLRDPWRIDLAGLEQAFADPGTSAYLLCNPHNPTGAVATHDELIAIAELARHHGVVVISDEIHAPLVLPGETHVPYLAIDADTHADVALTSASKGWNFPGLKCSFLVAGSDAMADAMRRGVPLEVQYGVGHLGVIASAAAYQDGSEWLARALATIDRNHALLESLLQERLPAIAHRRPASTYLAWLDCTSIAPNPAEAFLERGRVALKDGADFGAPGWVRLNLATSAGTLEAIVDRMALAASVAP